MDLATKFVIFYLVTIKIFFGENLQSSDYNGSSDPYCSITLNNQTLSTKVVHKSLNPKWDETFKLKESQLPESIKFKVYDWDLLSRDDPLGKAKLNLQDIEVGKEVIRELALDGKGKDKSEALGKIKVGVTIQEIEAEEGLAQKPLGIVRFNILEGKDLKKRLIQGKLNPYTTTQLGHQAYQTSIQRKTANPVWNNEARFWIYPDTKDYKLVLTTYTKKKIKKDEIIGSQYLDLQELLGVQEFDHKTKTQTRWVEIGRHGFVKDCDLNDYKKEILNKIQPINDYLKSMKKFTSKGKLLVSAKFYPMEYLTANFWKTFGQVFDTDEDGYLNFQELKSLFTSLGSALTDEEIEQHLRDKDLFESKKYSFQKVYETFGHLDGIMTLDKDPINNRGFDYPQTDKKIAITGLNMKLAGEEMTDLMEGYMTTGLEHPKTRLGVSKVMVYDRKTGMIVEEKIPRSLKTIFQMIYRTRITRTTSRMLQMKRLLKKLSFDIGVKKNSPKSVKSIPKFIRQHNINTEEILRPLDSFKNFNDFFIRELKPGSRPIDEPNNDHILISPADCRINVFSDIEQSKEFWIKGTKFNLLNLFGPNNNDISDSDDRKTSLSDRFKDGSLVIARLSPQDYHRVHSPISGTVKRIYPVIDGEYWTVSPLAIKSKVNVLTENKRQVVIINSKEFGDVALIMVGATCVGSIELVIQEGMQIQKGDQVGYFMFGGSTVLLVFENDATIFDKDLLSNSQKGIETLVKVGNRMGKSLTTRELIPTLPPLSLSSSSSSSSPTTSTSL
ncbi:phosphatidylserine decarboxylase [Anaeramoeba flamelloides]|uniref:phosphatidylserine decarboxylase n=1 Tax=Anaeramoeba flamelloides TaxID=1746091 RepID=A0ABQ8Y1D6_9EUKA|nr:phosphatidylserine decarboxylase [Anaeramoeba flamelloides]